MRGKFSGRVVEEKLSEKRRLLERIGGMLDEEGRRRAAGDHHARRRPRPCGMTVHTGIGCGYGCVYCYVPDMGFPMKPRPYPLSPLELVYALLLNKYVVPGPDGTLIAMGSVTEPFQPETADRAIDYIAAIRKYMGNPIQFSTKALIDEATAARIREASRGLIDALVTIITLRKYRVLEPAAPTPRERLKTMEELRRAGLHVTLFLRPIIPCVVDREELRAIVAAAAAHGAGGVVAGSLRVTRGIIERLRAKGLRLDCILSRLRRLPRGGREQVPVPTADLKKVVMAAASHYGLKYYPSACASNIDAHGLSCYMCRYGPCGDPSRLPLVTEDSMADAVEALGLRPGRVDIRGHVVHVTLLGGRAEHWMSEFLSVLSRRRVVFRASPGP